MTMQSEHPSRWPHRIAVLLTVIVFGLIWVGILASTYIAWMAGVVAVVLVVVTVKTEPREWVRRLAVALLMTSIFLGVVCSRQVWVNEQTVARLYAFAAPAFLAAAAAFCVVTSRWWFTQEIYERNEADSMQKTGSRNGHWLIQWPVVMLLISMTQVALGACLRHIDIMSAPAIYQGLVVAHVVTAVVIVAGTLAQWMLLNNSRFADIQRLRTSINILVFLVVAQFGLGLGTWVFKFGWPVWFENVPWMASFVVQEKTFWQTNLIAAHVAFGSLILANWAVHATRYGRIKHIYSSEKEFKT